MIEGHERHDRMPDAAQRPDGPRRDPEDPQRPFTTITRRTTLDAPTDQTDLAPARHMVRLLPVVARHATSDRVRHD
jgi:hypothetical protein